MLDDILDKVTGSGFDPRKVVDLVDDLWDSRKKIVEAVDLVWDNRDEIMRAVDFVRDHADDLLDLAKKLPGLLADAGEGLATAGDGAHRASAMLLGDGGSSVRDLADDAAGALERAHEELMDVMTMFAKLDDVPFMDPIVDGGARIGTVADDLVVVASRLRGVGGAITDAGENLDDVGTMLASSGGTLQALTGGSASKSKKTSSSRSTSTRSRSTKSPAKKKTPAKKTSTSKQKSAAKKSPAKKKSAAKKASTSKKKTPAKKTSSSKKKTAAKKASTPKRRGLPSRPG